MYLPPKAWVYKVPEYLSVECACLSELFVVAAILDRGKEYAAYAGKGFHFGDTVAVQGMGPIGCMMAAKARILGAGKIIALDNYGPKLELSKSFGVDITMNVSGMTDKESSRRSATRPRAWAPTSSSRRRAA